MTREDKEQSPVMGDEGDAVRARRERLGLHKNELAERAGISRDTLAAIENGEGFRRASLTRIENALSEFEEEMGVGAPPLPAQPDEAPHIIIVRLKNDVGEVAVEGPVDDLAELEAAARRLLRGLREDL